MADDDAAPEVVRAEARVVPDDPTVSNDADTHQASCPSVPPDTNGVFAARMVSAVVITLLLSSLAFSVGSAWNNAMQDMAKRKNVPLWVYATLMTIVAVIMVISLSFAARAAGADKVVGNMNAIAQMRRPSGSGGSAS